MMDSASVILDVLAATRKNEVRGKKRLQKLCFLLKETGLEFDAEFQLRDYGPFSKQIASSADLLSLLGKISETEETVGSFGMFVTVYKLSDRHEVKEKVISKRIQCLDSFTTTELEVAATIRFFERMGSDRETAIKRTQQMKPNKAVPKIIGKSDEIFSCL